MNCDHNPLVSVIIPAFNRESFVASCIRSVLSQTYKNIEILLVDDGSTDRTHWRFVEFAKQDPRITIFSQENRGVSSARNLGLSNAKGTYIYFLDSDDYIRPNLIRECVTSALESDCDVITFDTSPFSHDGVSTLHDYSRSIPENTALSAESLLSHSIANEEFRPTPWLYFFNSRVFKDNNLAFREGIVFEDNLLIYQVLTLNISICYLQKSLHFHRWHQDSITGSGISVYKLYSLICVIDGLEMRRAETNSPKSHRKLMKFLCCLYVRWAVEGQIYSMKIWCELLRLLIANPGLLSMALLLQPAKVATSYLGKSLARRSSA